MPAGLLSGALVPLVLASALGAGFLANEWSQGGMAEALGLGHHHAFDPGPAHCAQAAHPHTGANGTLTPGGHCGAMPMEGMGPGAMQGHEHGGGPPA